MEKYYPSEERGAPSLTSIDLNMKAAGRGLDTLPSMTISEHT